MKFFTAPRPGVRAFRVSRLARRERGVHEDLPEIARLEPTPGVVAFRTEGADERHDHDEAGVHREAGHFRCPPDVFHPVGLGEPKVPVEAMADVVPIQYGMTPFGSEALFDEFAIVDFPDPESPVNQGSGDAAISSEPEVPS